MHPDSLRCSSVAYPPIRTLLAPRDPGASTLSATSWYRFDRYKPLGPHRAASALALADAGPDGFGIPLAVPVAADRLGAARGFDDDVAEHETGVDAHGGDLVDGDRLLEVSE